MARSVSAETSLQPIPLLPRGGQQLFGVLPGRDVRGRRGHRRHRGGRLLLDGQSDQEQVVPEFPEAPGLGPSGLDPALIEGLVLILGPDQQQVGIAFAAGLGQVAAREEERPARLRRAQAAQEFSQRALDPLPCRDRRGRDGAQPLLRVDLGAGHGADPLPVFESRVVLAGQPEHDRPRSATLLAEDSGLRYQFSPSR